MFIYSNWVVTRWQWWFYMYTKYSPGGYEIFRPSGPALGPTQPPENGYGVFPGDKVRPERAADHSPPSSAAVMEE